ncbi:MAG: chemotaxis response regulator protein-glutamate methylesterase [Planctomycetota bacterium]
MATIRVLIIDDSALIRDMLTQLINADPELEVVGTAPDPLIAREKIKQLDPDVLTLDVEMPRMDGITFLRNLMRLRPMPVVMVSSLTEKGADVTLAALELGAVDFVSKPKIDVARGLEAYQEEIVEKIKVAADARVRPLKESGPKAVDPSLTADAVIAKAAPLKHYRTTDQLIAIGASTGGTEAIKDVVSALPADSPGIVITQHIPKAFSTSFANRLDSVSAVSVKEAEDGDEIRPGHAYLAPGDEHLMVERSGARFLCRVKAGPPVNRHCPSVDVLFRSVAQNVGPNAIGAILTGMGKDGAAGLKEMRDAGAPTFAQDERTSVVWGMPGEAVEVGAVDEVLPLHEIAGAILSKVRQP